MESVDREAQQQDLAQDSGAKEPGKGSVAHPVTPLDQTAASAAEAKPVSIDPAIAPTGVAQTNTPNSAKPTGSPTATLTPVTSLPVTSPPSTSPPATGGPVTLLVQPKRPSWLTRILQIGALGFTAAASATVGTLLALALPLPSTVAPQAAAPARSIGELWQRGFQYQITRPINILVMGIDLPLDLPEGSSGDVFSGRSDTMMLVRLDPNSRSVNVLSIPRDTQVDLPEEGLEKINYANALGGARMAAQVVSQNLNGVTIDRYVRVSTGAFRELVDLLGGVEVDVPEDMQYEDQTQKLKIDLKKGRQVLNGAQAEQFARFRNDANGDIGRVQRQQQLIRALRERAINPAMLTRIPEAIELFQTYVDTNLSSDEMLALVNFGLGLDRENFRMVMLPGRFSTSEEFAASYWIMDTSARDQLMQNYFNVSSIAAVGQQTAQQDLSIAVQNASSDPQLGSQVAAYLQDQGYVNVYVVEDASEGQTETQVIAQRGDVQSAALLKSVLGVGEVVPASTGDLSSDLTIRVGDDWLNRPHI